MFAYNSTAAPGLNKLGESVSLANLAWPIGAILLLAALGYIILLILGYGTWHCTRRSPELTKTHPSVACDYCPYLYAFTDACECSCHRSSPCSSNQICGFLSFPYNCNIPSSSGNFSCPSCWYSWSCSHIQSPACTWPFRCRQLDCCCFEIHLK